SWNSYVYLPEKTLDKGYYLFQVDDEGHKAQTLVQVTDLSAYINTSVTNSVIWVNDLKTGKPVEGSSIQIKDVDQVIKTGSDGIAKFATPDAWKTSKDTDNRTVSSFVKITSPDGKELVTALDNYVYYSNDKSTDYWKTLITDRPKYKPTDTIHFWGFLKPKAGVAKPDNLKMKLMYNWDTFVKEVPMTVGNDGTIEGDFDIKSFTPSTYTLNIYQGEDQISSTTFEVEDYVKPAYNLTMDSDKKAVFVGENINFNIKSEFFDGTPVANLTVQDNGQLDPGHSEKIFTTNIKGEAKASMVARKTDCTYENEEYCSDIDYLYYNIQSKLSEESAIQASSEVRIFNSHLNIASKGTTSKKEDGTTVANLAVKTNWIDLTKLNNGTGDQYNDYVADVAKNRAFTGNVIQVSWEKKETGEYYDFINKVTAKTYDYTQKKEKIAAINGVTNDSGEASYQFTIDPDKYYIVTVKALDDQNGPAHSTTYVYGDMNESSNGSDYYSMKVLGDSISKDSNDYWSGTNYQFDVGDTVDTVISKNFNVNLPKDTKGSFLFMQESNGIRKYDIKDSPYYSFKFEKENVPNVFVDGVWFDGKTYKPAFSTNIEYKKELKKLSLKIDSNKEAYKPGEEVSLSVYVTNTDGAPVAAKVNFNIVDEAYYKTVYGGMSDPLDQIYSSINSGVLLSYFTHNNPLNANNDAGGKGGCFTGETQISMADGTTKAIKDIQKGDKILTKESEFSSRLISAEVTGKTIKHVSEYLVINENLEVTAEHVVFANGQWTKVANLKLGDSMVDKDGHLIKIASMRRMVKPVDVYNIEIKNYHTYFANGFFVHNEKGDGNYYVRQQFKDTALFYSADVGADGRGSVKFKVPDNITSWRILATAINIDSLSAGTETKNIKVTLPFFVDMVLNREYSEKDKPMIKFRAYGKELKDGDAVSFKPEVDGLAEKAVDGKAFVGSYFNLPALPLGTHDVTVKADSGSLKDALKKTFEVKGSRLTQDVVKTIRNIDDKTVFDLGKQGQTEIQFLDSGVAYYYYNLLSLYYDEGKRLDQIVASKAAKDILNKYFSKGIQSHDEDEGNYILESYQRDGGLSLLPYTSKDLKLSALVVAFDVNLDRYSKHGLKDYFYSVFKDSKSNLDDIVLSLLGLASMKEPVLLDIREIAKAPELSVQQKLYLGLAYAKIGSYPDARKILQDVVNKLVGDTSNTGVHNLALGADLAASINDVLTAETLWKGVNISTFGDEDLTNLYELGYVTGALKNAKTAPVSFKYKLNNHDETVAIKAGESKSILASPGDVVAVSVNDGSLAAVLNYRDSVEPAQFKKDSRLSITRKYSVNGKETTEFNEGDMVKVEISLNNPGTVASPFYRVTDILPSGLTPAMSYMPMYGSMPYDSNLSYPFMINGQEISFCWFPYFKEIYTGTSRSKLVYYAKVVNPGTFYADPAKITSFYDHNVANISDGSMVKINPVK
ncbi:MAG: polymorphic toxin-type HINT domain-containing protein, partial [Candidatus Peregrinibacteria bacterium]|nr:polymorphic toxin-type HINT domain-containing protein [Candidatus Peregrinibacteria bacterium]